MVLLLLLLLLLLFLLLLKLDHAKENKTHSHIEWYINLISSKIILHYIIHYTTT